MRILWLKTELLHPLDKGGRIRSYQLLKELARDHDVTFLTLDDGTSDSSARASAEEYCRELICIPHRRRTKFTLGFYAELLRNLPSPLPYAIARYRSREMRSRLEDLARGGTYDVIVCDFLAPAVNVPRGLPCPVVLFQHNVEAMIWERRAVLERALLKRAYLKMQWRKMKSFEGKVCGRVNRVIAVSREDANTMQSDYHVPAIDYVPTGVDSTYFRPLGVERRPLTLVFTGSMDWAPNVDAVLWFTDAIMPLIKRVLPEVTLTVVGRNPSSALLKLSQRNSSIVVTGTVDDVRPYIDQSSAYVVPLRIGGGTRLKIYEAMAMDKPVISTTIGAEGLPVEPGKHLLIADTPAEFASAVERVLRDEQLASDLGRRSGHMVRSQFTWNRSAERFASICAIASETRPQLAEAAQNHGDVG